MQALTTEPIGDDLVEVDPFELQALLYAVSGLFWHAAEEWMGDDDEVERWLSGKLAAWKDEGDA
jgi:hypothetical protein